MRPPAEADSASSTACVGSPNVIRSSSALSSFFRNREIAPVLFRTITLAGPSTGHANLLTSCGPGKKASPARHRFPFRLNPKLCRLNAAPYSSESSFTRPSRAIAASSAGMIVKFRVADDSAEDLHHERFGCRSRPGVGRRRADATRPEGTMRRKMPNRSWRLLTVQDFSYLDKQ